MAKPRIASVFLAGCFGCHMSLLDIDERFEKLAELVEFGKSPLTDLKEFTGRYRLGYIEGGCANEENVHVVRELRKHCDLLVAAGECAIQGDIPSLRNMMSLRECLEEAYLDSVSTHNPNRTIPADPDLPLLLNKVHPVQDVVRIDVSIPGCPPRADAIWLVLSSLLENKPIRYPYSLLKYD